MVDEPGADLLEHLGLTEYEGTALTKLLELGRTTAPDLAEATGIPKARIYGVLDSLADEGYVKIIPGRPKVYQPKEVLYAILKNHGPSSFCYPTSPELGLPSEPNGYRRHQPGA